MLAYQLDTVGCVRRACKIFVLEGETFAVVDEYLGSVRTAKSEKDWFLQLILQSGTLCPYRLQNAVPTTPGVLSKTLNQSLRESPFGSSVLL